MKLKFYFSLCILSAFVFGPLLAQIPFAQVNQLPLQLNSSLAGAKEKNRLSLGGNRTSSSQDQQNNFAFSYDQVVKSIGSGVGFYGMYKSADQGEFLDSIKQKLPSKYNGNSFLQTQTYFNIGACIAPKFNINDPLNPNKIKYTFSPSFYIEYGRETVNNMNQISSKYGYSTLFSSQYPTGIQHLDSTVTRFVRYQITNNQIRSGLGLQLNTGKLLALAKLGFVRNGIFEQVEIHNFNKEMNYDKLIVSSNEYSIYSFEPTAHLGYSLGYTDSKFSLTPLVGAGLKTYFNLPQSATSSNENAVGSYDLSTRKMFEINYLHASLNMRYGKFLMGTTLTQFNAMKYIGLSVGFQNNNLKIIVNMGQHDSDFDKKIYTELTACVLW